MPKKIRPIRVEGNLAFVTLTQGYEAVIDADDAATIGQWNWYALVRRRGDGSILNVYAGRTTGGGNNNITFLHNVILASGAKGTDHRDGDGLNNRRDNLRPATRVQNAFNQKRSSSNTSGFKGVSFHRVTGKWLAQIGVRGKRHYLGIFSDPALAHAAYVEASAKHHGEFGRAK